MNNRLNIVLLVGKSESSRIVYNYLKKEFNIQKVIIENPIPRLLFLKKRVQRLGIRIVSGQILFFIFGLLLKWEAKNRLKEIKAANCLDTSNYNHKDIMHVTSVNDNIVEKTLKDLNPDAIVINGTRIISSRIIDNVTCPILNTHAGITPHYRGVHGAYWALVQNDKQNCGVTVHLIDKGIDTGDILYQKSIKIGMRDNFMTYPYLQLAAALPLLKKALNDTREGCLKPFKKFGPSRLWYHPTITQYLVNRLKKIK